MNESYTPTAEDFVFHPQDVSTWKQAEDVSGGKHDFAKRFFSKKLNIVGLVILTVLVLGSIILPLVGLDFVEQNLNAVNLAPSAEHWFGTDSLGRDLFSRCFMGLRISLVIAAVSTIINLIIGMNYGIISGYFGGMTDIIMQRIIDVIGSIPTLVVVTLLMIILQPGMIAIIIAL
ncbi:MAG: ABC transporter permease, partial [Eubacterium sp.]|nr:ABC transporter permease [Eubacterium sp.]